MQGCANTARILLIDLYSRGHHGSYLRALMRRWMEEDSGGRLDIVAPKRVVETVGLDGRVRSAIAAGRAGLWPLGAREEQRAEQVRGSLSVDRLHREVILREVSRIRPTHCLAMYFDHLQLSAALGLRLRDNTKLSGLLFKPTFHYKKLDGHGARGMERFRRAIKALVVRAAVRSRSLDALLCLDPYAVSQLRTWARGTRVSHVPDFGREGVVCSNVEEVRAEIGASMQEKVLLLFGVLSERKGIRNTWKALNLLPADLSKQLVLVVAGESRGTEFESSAIRNEVSEWAGRVVRMNGFLPEEKVVGLFDSATLVLMAYDGHVGSSGVLIRAAQSRTRVVAQQDGLVGKWVRDYDLGSCVDPRSPESIARAIVSELGQSERRGHDNDGMARFSAAHNERAFSQACFAGIVGDGAEL